MSSYLESSELLGSLKVFVVEMGYVYASQPQDISIKQIMDAVEENLDATNCSGTSSCRAGQQCNSHKLWDDLNSVVDEFLSDISISDLVEKPKHPHIPLKEIQS